MSFLARKRPFDEGDFKEEVYRSHTQFSPVALVNAAFNAYCENHDNSRRLGDEMPVLKAQARGMIQQLNVKEIAYLSMLINKELDRPVDQAEFLQADAELREGFTRFHKFFIERFRERDPVAGTSAGTGPVVEYGLLGILFTHIVDNHLSAQQKDDIFTMDTDEYMARLHRMVKSSALTFENPRTSDGHPPAGG